MRAFNDLMLACRSELRLFVDDYFHVLRALLDSQNSAYHQMAVASVCAFAGQRQAQQKLTSSRLTLPCILTRQLDMFADVKEQTPSYADHHGYFVERLSSLAWSNRQPQPEE